MPVRIAVLGAGPLGTAAAYDLARNDRVDEVRLLDLVMTRAREAAERINRQLHGSIVRAGIVNAAEVTGTAQVLEGLDGCLSAVPSALHKTVARAAILARVHYADLGGAASDVLELHPEAKAAGVSIIPDCGAAPGLANLLIAFGLTEVDAPHAVTVRAGDLPETRDLPLGYQPHFALEALATRYFGQVEQLVNGERLWVPALSGLETVEVAPFGSLEAFATRGGCDTCVDSYASRLTNFEFKTLRYPGHHRAVSLLAHLGFLSQDPVDLDGHPIVPLRVFQAVMERLWDGPAVPDIFVLRVDVLGRNEKLSITLVDRGDPGAQFTATQRCTGIGAGIVSAAQVCGLAKPGALPPERALEPSVVVPELTRRQLHIDLRRESS